MSGGSAGWHSRLLSADIFGDQVDIKIRGQKKFQTFFGSFLGAVGMLVMIAYSIDVAINMVDVSTPEVSAEDKYDYENHSFDISNSELLPLFTLLDKQTGRAYEFEDLPKIIRPVAYFVDQSQDPKTKGPSSGSKSGRILPPGPPPSGGGGGGGGSPPPSGGGSPPPSGGGSGPAPPSGGGSGSLPPSGNSQNSGSANFTNIPGAALVLQWVPCINLTNREPYTSIVNDNFNITDPAKRAWCLEIPKNASLYKIRGGAFSKNSVVLRMQFFPCSSDSCFNSTMLDRISVNMVNIKRYLQYSNFSQPVQKITQINNDIGLNTELGSFYVFYLRTVRISSSTNWFIGNSPDQEFSDIVKDNVYSFNRALSNCSKGSTPSSCQTFFTMEYRSSGIVTTHKRKYTELLTASSNIGGLKELIMVVGVLIYSWYNNIFQKRYLGATILESKDLEYLANYHQAYSKMTFPEPDRPEAKKVDSGPLNAIPIIKYEPIPTVNLAPAHDTTTSTPVASPVRLAPPKSVFEVARVRPKSRSKTPVIAAIAKRPASANPEKADVEISDLKVNANPPKVILKHTASIEEEVLTGNPPDRPDTLQSKNTRPKGFENSREDLLVKSLRLEADQLIEDIMSIETLLNELAAARVLNRMIFSDHHRKLVPLIEIECRRRKLESKAIQESLQRPKQNTSKLISSESVGSRGKKIEPDSLEQMNLANAIDLLQNSRKKSIPQPAHTNSPDTVDKDHLRCFHSSCPMYSPGVSISNLFSPLIDQYFADMLFGPSELPPTSLSLINLPELANLPEPPQHHVKSQTEAVAGPPKRLQQPNKRLSRAAMPAKPI